jgi:rhamnose transport system permease protein
VTVAGAMTPTGRDDAPSTDRRRLGWVSWDKGVVVLLVLTFAVGSLVQPDFAGASNITFILQDIGEVFLIALPMTFLIISGEIDLSVSSTAALASCVLGVAWRSSGSMWLALVAALLTGFTCGAVNGVLVTRLGLGSLAVTIGTLGLFRGLCYALLGDTTVADFPTDWTAVGYDYIPGTQLPWIAPVMLVFAVVFGVVLHLSRTGRWIFATGQSVEAARFAGIPVRRLKLRLFVLTGLVSGFAGVVYSLRTASARPDGALGLELAVIASALFGGVSIFGGVGTVWGVAAAVLFLGAIRSLLQLLNVQGNTLTIITGAMLLASVIVPAVVSRLAARRRRPPAEVSPAT